MTALLPVDTILGKANLYHTQRMLSLPYSPVGFFVVLKICLSLHLHVSVHNHSSLGTASFVMFRTTEPLNP